MSHTLFSAHPVTWSRVLDLYGELAQVTGVKEWYIPAKGWQPFPATSAMAMLPEQQIIALAEAGATAIQLYVNIPISGPDGFFDTRTPDFLIHELYTPPQPCSTSSTSTSPSAPTGTRPSTTSASSKATKPAPRRASKSTAQAGAPASPPPATSAASTTTSPAQCQETETENAN